jgi:hypothetical protein
VPRFKSTQVDDGYMTVATITGGSLGSMTNVQTAPRISAGVFARGYNFRYGAATSLAPPASVSVPFLLPLAQHLTFAAPS